MKQTPIVFQKRISRTVRFDTLRYLPPGFEMDAETKWPLILFLHGAGERGSNLDLVRIHGIPKVVEQRDLPFITLSPQCPENHWWSDFLPALDALIEDAIQNLNADPDRIYLTGLSMGGFGSWHLAVEYPHRFAAIAPICGGNLWMYSVIERVAAIRELPVWVFHGANDTVVPLHDSQDMVDALHEVGGDVRFTVYPETGHDSWTRTYDNPDLYGWFLSHSRKSA